MSTGNRTPEDHDRGMTFPRHRCLSLLLWLLIPAAVLALYLIPVSNRFTKVFALFTALIVWCGLFKIAWSHRRVRWVLPLITVLAGVFLLLPARPLPGADALRSEYTSALRRYDGTRYIWGGESVRGIDCSGLIRCGLMNALFQQGLRHADPGLLRTSLALWWNDTSAEALGKEHAGLTHLLFAAPSINEADATRLLPGDLAVTQNGVHILAYLGDGVWTQASPGAGRVISSTVPVENDTWFSQPVNLLRWQILAGQ